MATQIAPRRFASAVPLGLLAFGTTTFLLSLFLMDTRGVSAPNISLSVCWAYGGLVQLLAGMWEMASGNLFGATALSTYGGFWISYAIVLTPGGFQIEQSLGGAEQTYFDSLGFYLMAWFIVTFLIMLATLRSIVSLFALFLALDLAYLMLGIGYLVQHDGTPHTGCIRAGGAFAAIAAFLAYYNALAHMLDKSNWFFDFPVGRFPWSVKVPEEREADGKKHVV